MQRKSKPLKSFLQTKNPQPINGLRILLSLFKGEKAGKIFLTPPLLPSSYVLLYAS